MTGAPSFPGIVKISFKILVIFYLSHRPLLSIKKSPSLFKTTTRVENPPGGILLILIKSSANFGSAVYAIQMF